MKQQRPAPPAIVAVVSRSEGGHCTQCLCDLPEDFCPSGQRDPVGLASIPIRPRKREPIVMLVHRNTQAQAKVNAVVGQKLHDELGGCFRWCASSRLRFERCIRTAPSAGPAAMAMSTMPVLTMPGKTQLMSMPRALVSSCTTSTSRFNAALAQL
jgi:hypothetical protein